MNTLPRQPQALESYATFWEPVVADPTPLPQSNANAPADSARAADAYLEFVNVTEGAPAAHPAQA